MSLWCNTKSDFPGINRNWRFNPEGSFVAHFYVTYMTYLSKAFAPILFSMLALAAGNSVAGRPMAVDDANTNDAGSGHVEVFFHRHPGEVNTWTISPAYGVIDGVEISASFNRDTTNDVNTTGIQAKIRLSPSKEDGCNFATSFGLSEPNTPGAGSSKFINGLITCNMDEAGSVHLNLGLVNPSVGANTGVWGLAYERGFGAVTAHVEVFGAENVLPTVQFGLRTMLGKNLQLDGSIGSTNGESIYSVGFKVLF